MQTTTAAPIYDEVTEEEYNLISKRAAFEEDFVVDDNGEGYAGRGLEDWDNHASDYSSDEDHNDKGKRKRQKHKDPISNMFKQQLKKKAPVIPQQVSVFDSAAAECRRYC